jgi:hypothetical protein
VHEQYDSTETQGLLLARIVEMLYVEANEDDPVANGSISLENLHYVLRKELDHRPSRVDIEQSLDFLAHPLVNGVVKNGDKYRLVDSPSNIVRRLAALGLRLTEEGSNHNAEA